MKPNVKERSILMSGPMVRAILEGRKTQTRRAIRGAPAGLVYAGLDLSSRATMGTPTWFDAAGKTYQCPYGQAGDRLWVRETWRPNPAIPSDGLWYRADWHPQGEIVHDKGWKPSIYMPRWASRILLEVVSVWVERLHQITDADCKAEGVECWQEGNDKPTYRAGEVIQFTAKAAYCELWRKINGPASWDENPFVWVVEFKVVS